MEYFRFSFSLASGGRLLCCAYLFSCFFFLIFASAICLSNYCIVFLRFFHVVKLNTVHNY